MIENIPIRIIPHILMLKYQTISKERKQGAWNFRNNNSNLNYREKHELYRLYILVCQTGNIDLQIEYFRKEQGIYKAILATNRDGLKLILLLDKEEMARYVILEAENEVKMSKIKAKVSFNMKKGVPALKYNNKQEMLS